MDGVFKIIVIFLFTIFIGCKRKDNNISTARELITTNINVLIDSVRRFDMTGVIKNRESGELNKDYISIGLIDSVKFDKEILKNKSNISEYISLKLTPNEVVNFKSKYDISLVQVNNYDIKIVFVNFKNLQIHGNLASVEVVKVRGIGMINEIYYFEKINNKWVFKKKKLLSMG